VLIGGALLFRDKFPPAGLEFLCPAQRQDSADTLSRDSGSERASVSYVDPAVRLFKTGPVDSTA
jgi:hypothetical protein